MSENVPAKIKPIGTLQDFSTSHSGHYETVLYGHWLKAFGTLAGFFWDINRLFSWNMVTFFCFAPAFCFSCLKLQRLPSLTWVLSFWGVGGCKKMGPAPHLLTKTRAERSTKQSGHTTNRNRAYIHTSIV